MDTWVQHVSYSRRPRSTRICPECQEACIEGMPRVNMMFRAYGERDMREANLHPACAPRFINTCVRTHITAEKKASKT